MIHNYQEKMTIAKNSKVLDDKLSKIFSELDQIRLTERAHNSMYADETPKSSTEHFFLHDEEAKNRIRVIAVTVCLSKRVTNDLPAY